MYERPLRSDGLYHFGVKGMHWGVRRYQNTDGTLTAAGKKHQAKSYQKQLNDLDQRLSDAAHTIHNETFNMNHYSKVYNKADEKGKTDVMERMKKEGTISVNRINQAYKDFADAKAKTEKLLKSKDFNDNYVYSVRETERYKSNDYWKKQMEKGKHAGPLNLGESSYYQTVTANKYKVKPTSEKLKKKKKYNTHRITNHRAIRTEYYVY